MHMHARLMLLCPSRWMDWGCVCNVRAQEEVLCVGVVVLAVVVMVMVVMVAMVIVVMMVVVIGFGSVIHILHA